MWTHSYQRIGEKGGEEAHWCQVNKGRVAHKYFIHRTARYTDVCGRTINHWTIDGGECALTVPRVTHRQRCSIKINGRLTFAACHARNAASRMKRRCVISSSPNAVDAAIDSFQMQNERLALISVEIDPLDRHAFEKIWKFTRDLNESGNWKLATSRTELSKRADVFYFNYVLSLSL